MNDLAIPHGDLPVRLLDDARRAGGVIVRRALKMPAGEWMTTNTKQGFPFSVCVPFPISRQRRAVAKVGHVSEPGFRHYNLLITDPDKADDYKQQIEEIVIRQFLKEQKKRQKK